MLCKKPFRKGVLEYGCGQCQFCRINKVREWVGRMSLEAAEHDENCFVTLTYNDESLPCPMPENSMNPLVKKDLQNFLKRLRKAVYPLLFRYYAVGEYGDKSERPHYHLIIFGLGPSFAQVIQKCWKFGFTMTGTAESSSMSYVASYVMKKMTKPKDRRLKGRPPEFSVMSTGKPGGIGIGFVSRLKKGLETPSGKSENVRASSLSKIRLDQFQYPIGRYLRDKLYADIDPDGIKRERNNRSAMFSMAVRKHSQSSYAYEVERASKIAAQGGKIKRKVKPL